jgi:O-methyltransferase involved in polyketide biosynthesis
MANEVGAAHEMDRVSFTADAIVARRTLVDTPHAQGIYRALLKKVSGTKEEAELHDAMKPENLYLVPFFESRYLLLDKLIEATGIKNILELAAGLAPRSLNWTEDSAVEYVEFDLPRKSREKQGLIETMPEGSKIMERPNLHFEAGDATNAGNLERALSHFADKGPIVIANEGLLRYLTFEQKNSMAANILASLKKYGGYWITPDVKIPDQTPNDDPNAKNYLDRVSARIGMDVNANLFESIPAAKKFFEDCGFDVEEHSFREVVPEIVSPKRLNLSSDEIEKLVGWRVAFVMKPKVS